ncbi:MAG6450 family protein [Lihuaxuella thermophila]|uniref:Uncharacterized protein n=1 Tax=Lihuaxuella thermophila TaxID=1173111 RepID=A0A1H8H9X6_9BACL|nr:hypothetical protein [Lihuaxuella thermophila]SEN52945.1 hypothetical protein SAMN05444955_113105 [Lihuaxuella thermophila]
MGRNKNKKKKPFVERPDANIGDKKIKRAGLEARDEGNTDDQHPVFSFLYVDERLPITNMNDQQLKNMMNLFIRLEQMTWKDIKKNKNYYKGNLDIKTFKVPWPTHKIDPFYKVSELRCNCGTRIFGFRTGRTFRIVWFDANHDVYPHKKNG